MKVPKDYEGAYEESMKAKKTATAALTVSNVSDAPGPEFEETYMWPLITAKGKIKRPAPAATSLKNRFDAFGDNDNGPDDADDDETEMIKALSMITSNIKIQNQNFKGMTMARIVFHRQEGRERGYKTA